eukprot:TRINITY_DN67726_c2_g8_i1.p2 TRINITY_DN67726_c2_g8~~TRINITY_DN67726_c2_g8_i1.p2  ORF type:complete len:562 (+),score=342.52 TRINITY_DN67726_c2_g8_i1:131-1687(+)
MGEEVDDAKRLRKKQCKFTIKIIMAIYSIAIAAVAYQNWKDKGEDFQEMVDNWRQAPINAIRLVNASTDCKSISANWEHLSMENIEFPGAGKFCDCPGVGIHDRSKAAEVIKGDWPGNCFTNQTGNCTQRAAATAVTFNKWYGSKLCVHRLGGYSSVGNDDTKTNAINRPRVQGNKACPAGYRVCGDNSAAAADTEWTCVPTSDPEGCPIQDFARQPDGDVTTLTNKGYNCSASWGTGHKLCFKKVDSNVSPFAAGAQDIKLPQVKVQFTTNSSCFPGRNDLKDRSFDDTRHGQKRDCSKTDTRWIKVSSRADDEVYNEHGVVQFWVDKLKLGQPNGGVNEVLSYRNAIGWRLDCKRDRFQMADNSANVDRLKNSQLAVLIINIILGVTVNLIYGFWECRQKDDDSFADDTPAQLRRRRCKMCFVIAGNAGKMIPLVVALGLSINLRSIFADIKDQNCSNETETNDSISFFAKETNKQSTFNILLIVGAVVEVLLEIRTCRKSCTDRRNVGDKMTELH